jgi:CBS domain-containing protein
MAAVDDSKSAEKSSPLKGGAKAYKAKLIAALKGMKVSELKITRTPIVLDAALPVEAAIRILLEHKLRCAPVTSETKWEGVLDVRDCLKYAVAAYKKTHKDKDATVSDKSMASYFTDAVHKSTDSVRYLARMRPLNAIYDSESVLELLKVLSTSAHIICIVQADADDKLKFKGIVSQGEVYAQVSEKFSPLWKSSIGATVKPAESFTMGDLKDLGFVVSPVISISSSEPAHVAFEKMSKKGLSGLAVVDEDGELVHNTSSTDIKLWLQSSTSLDMSIEDFLVTIRRSAADTKAVFPVSYVTMDAQVSKAMEKLYRTRYHRIWIVDEDKKPIGVMSLTDIFKFLTRE